jgi:hypothetical protein
MHFLGVPSLIGKIVGPFDLKLKPEEQGCIPFITGRLLTWVQEEGYM